MGDSETESDDIECSIFYTMSTAKSENMGYVFESLFERK